MVRDINAIARNVTGISVYLQPVQDLTVDSTISRAQYQFVLGSAANTTLDTWVPRLVNKLSQLPALEHVSTNYLDDGLSANIVVDRDSAARFGITSATIDNALYDAFGQRIISTIFTLASLLHARPLWCKYRASF